MKQFKIGLQLYSIRDAMTEDPEAALKAVKEMGYDYVEYAGSSGGKSWAEVRELLDKYELTCVSVHQQLDTLLDDPQEALDQVHTLGAKYCAICKYDLENYTQRWDETMEKMHRWGSEMKAAGIRGLYHNHAFEFEQIDGEYILDKIFATIPHALIALEPDVAWIHYGGEEPAAYLEKYSGKLDVVHVKDFTCDNLPNAPIYELVAKHGRGIIPPTRPEAGFRHLPVGSGIQDWPRILEACERAGAEYLIVEQDESKDCSTLEAAEKSVRYLKALLAE